MENKLRIKVVNFACFKREEKATKIIKKQEIIKAILSTLLEINSPHILGKEN